MSYQFWYKLKQAPEAKTDGSGCVKHLIEAYEGPDKDNLTPVYTQTKDFEIPAADLKVVMDMPDSPQGAKVNAYKDLLEANPYTRISPHVGS